MNTTPKKIKVFLILAVIFICAGFVGFAFHASAATPTINYVPLAPLPGIGDSGSNAPNLPNYLIAMFKLLIGAAAALAVIMITIGGIEMMSTDSISGHDEGKKKIRQALEGLLLAIVSWLVLNTVNPETLKFKFNPDPIQGARSQQITCEQGQELITLQDGTRVCQ